MASPICPNFNEYLWPEMRKSFCSSKKAPTSFHTFSMVDGPSSYLQSNRENSKRLGKKVKEELGSLGRTLIENLESIENETEFNAGHAFVRRGFLRPTHRKSTFPQFVQNSEA